MLKLERSIERSWPHRSETWITDNGVSRNSIPVNSYLLPIFEPVLTIG